MKEDVLDRVNWCYQGVLEVFKNGLSEGHVKDLLTADPKESFMTGSENLAWVPSWHNGVRELETRQDGVYLDGFKVPNYALRGNVSKTCEETRLLVLLYLIFIV